jgi:hypothetical protein
MRKEWVVGSTGTCRYSREAARYVELSPVRAGLTAAQGGTWPCFAAETRLEEGLETIVVQAVPGIGVHPLVVRPDAGRRT